MYDHGADIYKYQEQLIDYSSNINPLGVPHSFKKAMIDHINDFNRYPDHAYEELREVIGRFLEVKTEDVHVGNGSLELIHHVIKCGEYKQLLTLAPTFSEYEKAAISIGLPISYCYLEEKIVDGAHSYVCNMDKLIEQIIPGTLLVLCQPNNPTGSMFTADELRKVADVVREKDGHLLLDEAFIELSLHPEATLIHDYEAYPQVIFSRAATKYFGMPGLRLGYMVTANKAINKRLEEASLPWHVNTAAVIARVIFQDEDYKKLTLEYLKEIKAMYDDLKMIQGLKVYKSHSIFHLIQAESKDAYDIKAALIQKGFLIRTPQGFKGIDSTYFRVTVKNSSTNRDFIKELERCI